MAAKKMTEGQKRAAQRRDYGKALAELKKDPHDPRKLEEACRLIPDAPPRRGQG